MSENNFDNLSENEKRLIYEAALTGLLKIKEDLENAPSDKKWLWRLFESSAGAAIITVLIGGIFGTIISTLIQHYSKQREFEQTFIKARHDKALIAFKEFSERREEFIKGTLKIIAETIITSDDYARFPMSSDMPKDGEPKDIIEKKTKLYETIATKYKTNSDSWQKEENVISDSMTYYFPDLTEPSENFKKVQSAMAEYSKCVNSIDDHPQNPCYKEKSVVEENFLELKKSFGKNRTYEWKELNDPQKTKEFLEKVSQANGWWFFS